jgi:Ca2+-binding RTX toxin-like protein
VINAGAGTDTFAPAAGGAAFLGTYDGGTESDTVNLTASDYSANGVWTNIEVLNLAGATTLAEKHLDNDSTFNITGANAVITVANVASVDLSNVTFQAGNTSSFALTGTGNADVITGSDAADTLTGGGGTDTISGGLGADTIDGGAGVDTLTGGGGSDNFVIDTAGATANRFTVTDFVAGAGGDVLQFNVALSKLNTAHGAAPVLDDDTQTATVGGDAYAMVGATSANADVVILASGAALSNDATNGGDLSAATDGSELLKALSTNAVAETGITVTAGDEFIAVAYQGGNAYIYLVQEDTGDALAGAAEIELVAVLTGVAADALDVNNFDLVP